MDGWIGYALLAAAGCMAGAVNVIAGGGSFLTLPLLIFLGLPATVANGTNRVAILLQNVAAVWGFHRHGVLDWRALAWAAVPATIGSVFGAWAALAVGDEVFKKILAILMVAVTLWTLWDPFAERQLAEGVRSGEVGSPGLALGLGFFLVGVYGGFVQAGVGFLVLAGTTWAGLDLIRGNAVKVLTVLASTAVSLAIFVSAGKIHWGMGLALAAGMVAGGLVGVRLTVLKGHAWVKGVVTATVVAFAVKLWLG
ncbi:sulfite exporter TauE/SafE family protein [Nitrospira sp. Kam-Ns4a]